MGVNYLPPLNSEKRPVYSMELAGPDALYQPRSFDWFPGVLNSLYNKDESGGATVATATDIGDASMKFYDSSGSQLIQGGAESDSAFQTRLTANCTMTDVIWTPTFDRKCIGAKFSTHNRPTWPAYLWAFVDLISIGGSANVPYSDGGIPLHMMGEDFVLEIDGRTVPDQALVSGVPVVFRCRHDLIAAANQFGMHVFLEYYR